MDAPPTFVDPAIMLTLAVSAGEGHLDAASALFGLVLLLLVAAALGAIAERLRVSAIVGYLVAGTLLGPHVLQVVETSEEVDILAELGVALLLFTIGLEFSFQRMMRLGKVVLGGGVLQIAVTMFIAALIAWLALDSISTALALGGIAALSSTACVLRVLLQRAQLESQHGRNALGILLVQDLAVVPLVLMLGVLSGEGTAGEIAWQALMTVVAAVVLIGAFIIVFNFIVPRLLGMELLRRNREIPVLLAIVAGIGSALITQHYGLSPALGAFVAGMLLGGSPFATQFRADVSALRIVLGTLFFASVGMLGNPMWIGENWLLVAVAVIVIVVGKSAIIWAVMRALGQPSMHALASGFCLAQIGEFSLVLALVARDEQLLSDHLFNLVGSTTIVTLFVTPFMVTGAPAMAARVTHYWRRLRGIQGSLPSTEAERSGSHGHTIVIGFGPAGRGAAEALKGARQDVLVIDLNFRGVRDARAIGFDAHLGDASHADVLEHAHVNQAHAVVISLPDPTAVRHIIEQVRAAAPNAAVIARCRYHRFRDDLEQAGAHVIIDEEESVGELLAQALRDVLKLNEQPANTSQ